MSNQKSLITNFIDLLMLTNPFELYNGCMIDEDNLQSYIGKMKSLAISGGLSFELDEFISTIQYFLKNHYDAALIKQTVIECKYHYNISNIFDNLDIIRTQNKKNFVLNIDVYLNSFVDKVNGFNNINNFIEHINTGLTTHQQERLQYKAIKFYCEQTHSLLEKDKNKFTDKLFELAWTMGHSSGAERVCDVYDDLFELYTLLP